MKKPDLSDAFGHQLMDYYNTGKGKPEIVEREDGFISVGGYGPVRYFSEYKDWGELDKKTIQLAKGNVLDIGCGAGRHALYLQNEKKMSVTGIDVSPLAIKVCKLRGLKKAKLLPIDKVDQLLPEKFDTVMMLGNNFGLLQNFSKAQMILKNLYKITSEDGIIIAETTDPTTTDPDHTSYHKLNKKRGKMIGQLKIRVRYRKFADPWFEYLLVTKKELEKIIKGTGWKIREYIDDGMGYTVILEK